MTEINFVDVLLLLGIILFAWSGWRQGFVAALASFIGFIGGGLIGAFLAPVVLRSTGIEGLVGLAITAILILALAVTGQIASGIVGRKLRDKITVDSLQKVDNAGGAVINVVALVIIGWVLAATAAALPQSSVAGQVKSSTLLTTLDQMVPSQARDLVTNLRGLVDDSGLPQLFDSFGVLPPPQVDVPTSELASIPAVSKALESVVRVEGNAPTCNSGFTGSGYVVAANRVITNAHVVAGVPSPRVHFPNGDVIRAKVVYLDPRVDVAVLAVEGTKAKPLKLAEPAQRGDDAVIVGYPGGGEMTVTSARVRGTMSPNLARGTDIYGNPGVAREIYALRGIARPGNSGGPLLTTDGRVSGLIFAQAEADPDTAYALTANQIRAAIDDGVNRNEPVAAGQCAAE